MLKKYHHPHICHRHHHPAIDQIQKLAEAGGQGLLTRVEKFDFPHPPQSTYRRQPSNQFLGECVQHIILDYCPNLWTI